MTKEIENMRRMDGHDSARTIAEEAERCFLMLLELEKGNRDNLINGRYD